MFSFLGFIALSTLFWICVALVFGLWREILTFGAIALAVLVLAIVVDLFVFVVREGRKVRLAEEAQGEAQRLAEASRAEEAARAADAEQAERLRKAEALRAEETARAHHALRLAEAARAEEAVRAADAALSDEVTRLTDAARASWRRCAPGRLEAPDAAGTSTAPPPCRTPRGRAEPRSPGQEPARHDASEVGEDASATPGNLRAKNGAGMVPRISGQGSTP